VAHKNVPNQSSALEKTNLVLKKLRRRLYTGSDFIFMQDSAAADELAPCSPDTLIL